MKKRASRNRTMVCSEDEIRSLSKDLLSVYSRVGESEIENRIINQNTFCVAPHMPQAFADLMILDPPYNLSKNYDGRLFKEMTGEEYRAWFTTAVRTLKPMLKPTATVYVCSDWKTSILIAPVICDEFKVRNRITWARDKGRGASRNWKNNSEDIWFCTVSDRYTFNVDAVKSKRRVIAPYREDDGSPKDWKVEADGKFRLTYPSNIWTDMTVPFWSMRENTDHPTQKPEKLIAKLILASSNRGDFVFDPFLGSGTTAVVAKKLDRRFLGIEIDHTYCCWALKRLRLADENASIQGYADGVFVERNTPIRRTRGKSGILSKGVDVDAVRCHARILSAGDTEDRRSDRSVPKR